MVGALLRSLRPAQWVRNLFVLAPIVFAHRLADSRLLVHAALAFAAFCAAASAIYLVNDLRDRAEDRQHPLKRLRPIASGELDPRVAALAATLLVAAATAIALSIGNDFALLLAAYLALNLLYSLALKHIVILDVMSIAACCACWRARWRSMSTCRAGSFSAPLSWRYSSPSRSGATS
jgi:4-hydroxybenzoate polyprenyltransferase